jgi:hypothetical protein
MSYSMLVVSTAILSLGTMAASSSWADNWSAATAPERPNAIGSRPCHRWRTSPGRHCCDALALARNLSESTVDIPRRRQRLVLAQPPVPPRPDSSPD